MATKTYVVHCEKCNLVIESHLKDSSDCPVRKYKKVRFTGINRHGEYERKRFPYYDECLDTYLTSSGHKNQVLKERGLVQVDGFFNKKPSKKNVFYSLPKK